MRQRDVYINKIKLALLFGCLLAMIAVAQPLLAIGQQPKPKPTTPLQTTSQAPVQSPKGYGQFTHQSHLGTINVPGTNQTRILKCESCHERRDLMPELVPTTARNKQLGLKFPGHQACFECHVPQFTANPPQTCSICHNAQPGQTAGLTARPPQRDFPRRYDFNAFFDARQHELHVKYALPNGQKTDCNFCHKQDAKPAVLTIASHPECYACHAPTSGDKLASQKSDCQVCHTQMAASAQPFAAKYTSQAYGARFTHKQHVGYVNNDCYACHTINGGYNQSSPGSLRVKQHVTPNQRGGRGCFSCHDGRRAFSGEYDNPGGAACIRCHTREDFKVFPSSG